MSEKNAWVWRRPSTWISVGLLALALGMITFIFVASAWPGAEQLPTAPSGLVDAALVTATVAAWVSMLLAGTILSIRRPHNPIGWLLLVSGLAVVYTTFAPEYVMRVTILGWPLPAYRLIDWILPLFEMLGIPLIAIWIPLLFPDGRLVGPRWRPVAWVMVLTITCGTALPFLTDDRDEFGRQLPNPTALGGAGEELAEALSTVLTVALVSFIILAFVSVIIRFRRSEGVERHQMKWFLGAAGLVFVSVIGMGAFFVLEIELLANSFYFVNQIAIGLIPIAIGIAVLRYRLYEIDRIISRTIGWAIVTGLLVGTFALLVIGWQAVLSPLTGGSTLAVAGSTLVVAALFSPVRSRVQRAVDRRFDRSRYDGERLLADFGERLRDEVDLPTISREARQTVDAAVRPASVGLWLRGGSEGAG